MSTAAVTLRRRDLAWAVALTVLLSAIWVARGDVAGAGADPPGEGIAVVYIAVGTGFADALGVGPGAAANGAPIIIVPTNPPLDTATETELIRLDPRKVIIVGGTGVVSDSLEDTLVALLPNATVERIAGTNRYKTNAAFSAATYPIEGWVSINSVGFDGIDRPNDIVVATETGVSNGSGTEGTLRASIALPHGAIITELIAVVVDLDGSESIYVALGKANAVSALNGVIASVTSTDPWAGGTTTLASSDILEGHEVVDNENFTYYIQVEGATSLNLTLTSVRVGYQIGATG